MTSLPDLRTTYNVLSELDYPVPAELLLHLSHTIRARETAQSERALARMSEEQLIRLENKQRRTLRIYTAEGLLIQKKTHEETFRTAILQMEPERVAALGLRVGRKPLVLSDATFSRRRVKHYFFLCPGFFLLRSTRVADKFALLTRIDQLLRLGWDIELV